MSCRHIPQSLTPNCWQAGGCFSQRFFFNILLPCEFMFNMRSLAFVIHVCLLLGHHFLWHQDLHRLAWDTFPCKATRLALTWNCPSESKYVKVQSNGSQHGKQPVLPRQWFGHVWIAGYQQALSCKHKNLQLVGWLAKHPPDLPLGSDRPDPLEGLEPQIRGTTGCSAVTQMHRWNGFHASPGVATQNHCTEDTNFDRSVSRISWSPTEKCWYSQVFSQPNIAA